MASELWRRPFVFEEAIESSLQRSTHVVPESFTLSDSHLGLVLEGGLQYYVVDLRSRLYRDRVRKGIRNTHDRETPLVTQR